MTDHAAPFKQAKPEPTKGEVLTTCVIFSMFVAPIAYVFVLSNSVILSGLGTIGLVMCALMLVLAVKPFFGDSDKNSSIQSDDCATEDLKKAMKSKPDQINHYHTCHFEGSSGTGVMSANSTVYTKEEFEALQRDANRLNSGRPSVIPAPRASRRA